MVIFITGEGKGKTTAAAGAALRASGQGLKTAFLQFCKKRTSGELKGLKKLKITVKQFGTGCFIKKKPEKKDIDEAEKCLDFCRALLKKKYGLIILDEIFMALKYKLIKQEEVINLIKNSDTHFILTGRSCPESLYKYAQTVSEIKEIKHHYGKTKKCVKGVDY